MPGTIRRRQAKSFVVLATGALLWPLAAVAQGDSKPVDNPPAATAPATPPAPAATSPAATPTPAPAQPKAAPEPQAQTPAPAPQQPAAKAPATETPAVVMNGQQVTSVLGKKVRGADGADMGRIVDIIADKSGQLRAAIIDFGGFLGVGSRQIAVDWNAIRFPSDGKTDAVEVDLTRDQLRVAPAYKPGEQIVVLGSPSSTVGVKSPAPSPGAQPAAPPTKAPPSK